MKILGSLTDLNKLFREVRLQPVYFIVPAFLGLCASLFEGAGVSLLIPLTDAILQLDVSRIREAPVIGHVLGEFPKIFSTNRSLYITIIAAVFSAMALRQAFQYGSSVTLSYMIRTFTHRLRETIFNRFLSFGKLFFDRTSSGHLHEILTSFTQAVGHGLMELNSFLTNFFLLAVYLVVLFTISWKLTLLSLIIFPLLNHSLSWLIQKIKKTSEDYAVSQNELGKNMFNILSCIPLVKAYSKEEDEKNCFSRTSQQVRMFEFSIDKKIKLIQPLQEMIMLVAILILVSAMAFLLVRRGDRSTIAAFLVYFYVLRRAAICFGVIDHMRVTLASVSGPLQRITDLILNQEDKFFVPEGTREFEGLKHGIEFRHLTFSYAEAREVLKDISFKVEKGKMTALVGPTGAGKTTLVHLLLRFYDCPPGTILMDAEDIRSFTLKSLHEKMAIVTQETLLFNDTLRNNITYGLSGEISESKLLDVLHKARLDDYVTHLIEGLETRIGDRGVQLSGGEKQRVSIARAMLKNADVLILDEATSSLDSTTEKLIQEAIEELTHDKTTIVIAHRLSTIKRADNVIILEGGQLVESGKPNELLKRQDWFYHYWEAQRID